MWQAETVLLLGGTAEARAIAPPLKACAARVIVSEAGVTETPSSADVSGGFGGLDGLKRFLHDQHITTLIDATHPYATTMTTTAQRAAADLSLTYIQIERPLWMPEADDHWTQVASVADIILKLTSQSAVPTLISLGARHVEAFRHLPGPMIYRTVDPLQVTTGVLNITGKGPFEVAEEEALFDQYGIGCVVCKNSGGPWAKAKLDVARARHIPVLMLTRPPSAIDYGRTSTLEAVMATLSGS